MFCDLALIADRLFPQNDEIRQQLLEADNSRTASKTLSYLLTKHKPRITPFDERLIALLKEDDEYFHETQRDMRRIEAHRNKFRVQLIFEGNRYRRSFTTLSDAQAWRDEMENMFADITANET